jgi:aryl-alcohol dehydrogenase-like predicted oxidoreductase
MDDAQRKAILNAVLDSGINFIDTSDDYGNSEELIGRHLSHRQSEFYLATKCGSSPSGHVWTSENVLRNLEESLRRLKVDHVDLMQLHNPPVEDCESGGLVDALLDMRRQGKVRWIGVSTTLPDLPTYLQWGVFDTFQIPYSALQREHEGWITRSAEAGTGIIVRGGVALGESGKGKGAHARWGKFDEAKLDELRQAGESRTAFLLRFTLTHPHAHTTIVGTTDPGHLSENVEGVLRGPLPADVYQEAKRRMDAAGVEPAAVT